jgi:transcriptional regulator of acetoin/glycerol metabolism
MEALLDYDWPGNVRELENVIYRSVVAAEDSKLMLLNLPAAIRRNHGEGKGRPYSTSAPTGYDQGEDVIFPLKIIPMEELERKAMQHALHVANGNLTLAAKKLGMGRATFYRKLAKYGI